MLVEIEAKFSCDECGTEFFVTLEPSYCPRAGLSVFAVAEDAIRGGTTYVDYMELKDDDERGTGSVGDDGRHYCRRCTRQNDKRNH